MSRDRRSLTRKQERFVAEYLKDLCATRAALRAGYKDGTYGRELLSKAHVAHAVHAAIDARARRTELDQDYVIRGLVETVERCMQRKPVMEWDPNGHRMRQKVDNHGRGVWQFDAHAAIKALALLGKHQGMFSSRVQVTGLMAVLQAIMELPASEAERLLELPDEELRGEVRRLASQD